jgi:polyisoprenyl-teichoic acid--peptidoglycan teichoic acid transferase
MKNEAALRKVLWAVIVALLLVIAWLVFAYQRPGALRTALAPMVNSMFSSLPGVTLSEPTTILFMGTDVSYTGNRGHLTIDPSCFKSNTDTMMLGFLNPQARKAAILNIPRDTEAYVGRCGVQKINSANAIGGPELSRDTVSSLLGVPVHHYVVMNLQGLVQLVNEIGGVTVEIPKKMSYMDWTAKLKIDLEPGVHTLTGNQSMGFVRFRHDALGDIGRVQRQQIFLQAVARKMGDPATWMHVPALLQIAQNNIQTDMNQIDLIAALNFLHSIPKENIKFVMLPGQFSPNGNWIATTDGRALALQLANPDMEYVSSRKNISVCVVNATPDRTFGSKVAQALRKLGYVTAVERDDPDTLHKNTQIIVQNGNTANARMLQQDLGNVGTVVNASVGSLLSSITVVAHSDLNPDNIRMSSVDAPYAVPNSPPTPIVVRQPWSGRSRTGEAKTPDENAVPLPGTDENQNALNNGQTNINPDEFSHETSRSGYPGESADTHERREPPATTPSETPEGAPEPGQPATPEPDKSGLLPAAPAKGIVSTPVETARAGNIDRMSGSTANAEARTTFNAVQQEDTEGTQDSK